MKKTSEKITDQESVQHLRQRFHCSLAGASVDAHSTSLAYKSVIVTALTSQFMHTNPFLPLISILYFVKKTRTVKKKNINYMCNVISTKVPFQYHSYLNYINSKLKTCSAEIFATAKSALPLMIIFTTAFCNLEH